MQRLVDAGALSGTIRDAASQAALAGAAISVAGPGLTARAGSDAGGGYVIDFLVGGVYSVTARLYGYETLQTAATITPNAATTLDLDLAPLPHFTVSGHVREAISTTLPIAGAKIKALDTPLAPAVTDAGGAYTLSLPAGDVKLEVSAFGFATTVTDTTIMTDTAIDFSLDPLPPILLVDDDEGGQRSYSPNVESYYFTALDADGYAYDYWDIEQRGGPTFDTLRQYPAVVWFGGEFGRVKDISDADQAQALMSYLDVGGRLLYVAQDHTFYYGDDKPCDTPTWGGNGPCPFTSDYLGAADWIKDQQADVNYGVGRESGRRGSGAATDDLSASVHRFQRPYYGHIGCQPRFHGQRRSPGGSGELDRLYVAAACEWFRDGIHGDAVGRYGRWRRGRRHVRSDEVVWYSRPAARAGLCPSPANGRGFTGREHDGPSTVAQFRRPGHDLRSQPGAESLAGATAGCGGHACHHDGTCGRGRGCRSAVTRAGAGRSHAWKRRPGRRSRHLTGPCASAGDGQCTGASKMSYQARDSNVCGSGIEYDWIDATSGQKWVLDDISSTPTPEFLSVPLPAPFEFYNQVYDHSGSTTTARSCLGMTTSTTTVPRRARHPSPTTPRSIPTPPSISPGATRFGTPRAS